MKISASPLVRRYCDCYGVDIKEALSWINEYVNAPDPAEIVSNLTESDEKARLESMRKYIQWMVDNSVTARVRFDNEAGTDEGERDA